MKTRFHRTEEIMLRRAITLLEIFLTKRKEARKKSNERRNIFYDGLIRPNWNKNFVLTE